MDYSQITRNEILVSFYRIEDEGARKPESLKAGKPESQKAGNPEG